MNISHSQSPCNSNSEHNDNKPTNGTYIQSFDSVHFSALTRDPLLAFATNTLVIHSIDTYEFLQISCACDVTFVYEVK